MILSNILVSSSVNTYPLVLLLLLLPAMLPHVMGKVEKHRWADQMRWSDDQNVLYVTLYSCFHIRICAFMSMLAINANKLPVLPEFWRFHHPFPLWHSKVCKKPGRLKPSLRCEGHWLGFHVIGKPKWACSQPTTSFDTAVLLMAHVWWDCSVVSGGLWLHHQPLHPNPYPHHGLLGVN